MRLAVFEFFVRRADDQPKNFFISVVEDLSQSLWADEHAATFRNGQRLIANSDSSRAFHDKIKFIGLGMFVKRVRALRQKSP